MKRSFGVQPQRFPPININYNKTTFTLESEINTLSHITTSNHIIMLAVALLSLLHLTFEHSTLSHLQKLNSNSNVDRQIA